MILVIGATGTIGSHLIFNLLKNNDKVVAIKRKNSKFDILKNTFSFYTDNPNNFFNRIIWKQADITNIYSLESVFNDVDYIYNCAGYVSFKNKNKEKFLQNNVIGIKNIVDLSLEKNIKKLVHLSSIASLGYNNYGLTTEDHLFNTEDVDSYYSLSKYLGELEVWRGVSEGLNAVILNPSVVLAPYKLNKFSEKIFKYIFKNGIKYYTCGKKGFVDVIDLVEIMQKIMNCSISNQRFIVSAENISFKTLTSMINRSIGKKKTQKKLSLVHLKFLSILNFIISFGNPLINKKLIFYATNDELYSSEKLLSFIEHNFKFSQLTIDKIINFYQKKVINK